MATKIPKPPSSLEAMLEQHLAALGLRERFKKEYEFAPPRRWRFDFADPAWQIAIECEGLVAPFAGKSRHTTNDGFSRDCEKYNTAAVEGWIVLRFTKPQIRSGESLIVIERAVLFRVYGVGAVAYHRASRASIESLISTAKALPAVS